MFIKKVKGSRSIPLEKIPESSRDLNPGSSDNWPINRLRLR